MFAGAGGELVHSFTTPTGVCSMCMLDDRTAILGYDNGFAVVSSIFSFPLCISPLRPISLSQGPSPQIWDVLKREAVKGHYFGSSCVRALSLARDSLLVGNAHGMVFVLDRDAALAPRPQEPQPTLDSMYDEDRIGLKVLHWSGARHPFTCRV